MEKDDADATARTRFASEVKKIIEQYDFDGVDFDFEWPTNASEYNNYSATVIQMRSTLGKYVYFTASLHPVSFKISPELLMLWILSLINVTALQ